VVTVAVRWYLRHGLSFRDVEETLAERGVKSITSPSTAGSSGSRCCWLMRLALPGTCPVIGF